MNNNQLADQVIYVLGFIAIIVVWLTAGPTPN